MTVIDSPKLRNASVTLESGDRMTRAEFHRLYEQTPEDFKAELIGGIVYVASPLRLKHGTAHPWLSALLFAYQVATPGVELGDNATVLLGDDSEPQPDLFLRIVPEAGGLSRNTSDDYVDGPPELVVEIALSSKSLDLHSKRDDYARGGIPEYLVYLANEQKLRWFDLKAGKDLQPTADGIYQIQQFPGLWISGPALVERDFSKLSATLSQGLGTTQHKDFVQRLSEGRLTRRQ